MKPSGMTSSLWLMGSARIANRLRFVFALIGIVILGAGALMITQAMAIVEAHNILKNKALPMLTLAHRTENNLAALVLGLERLRTRPTPDELGQIRRDALQQNQAMRANLATLRNYDISPELIDNLDGRLLKAQDTSARVIRNRTTQLAVDQRTAKLNNEMGQAHDNALQILSPLARQTTAAAGVQGQIAAPAVTFDPDAPFNRPMEYTLNAPAIQVSVDTLINLADGLSAGTNAKAIARAAQLFDRELSAMRSRVQKLPPGPNRQDLFALTAQFRTLLLGQDGLVTQLSTQQKFHAEFASNQTDHLRLMTQISALSPHLVTRAREQIENSTVALNISIQGLIWTAVVASCVAIVTLIAGNGWLIERQFIQRIKALNAAVVAIARGDLAHPIPVNGNDELAEMANALQVFKENAKNLRRSNTELEKFAYVAAHDLRSPLRAIQDLAQWTTEDEENALSPESRDYMALLRKRAQRLNALLNDLLDYALVGQDDAASEVVDLENLIEAQFRLANPKNRFALTYSGDTGPIAIQEALLADITENILENAIKHHDRPSGKILVSASVDQEMLTLTVKDDGPGIDPQYQEQVFGLFQTLRPRDEVEGSGLGLAIVRKLVSQQNGHVRITSDPARGRGTSIRVSLPLAQQDEAAITQAQAA